MVDSAQQTHGPAETVATIGDTDVGVWWPSATECDDRTTMIFDGDDVMTRAEARVKVDALVSAIELATEVRQ